jgi:hypothetical protein
MNKQEAIQQQIDKIMDTFDFALCVQSVNLYKNWGDGYPRHWMEDGEFQEGLLRQTARDCMKTAAIHGYCGHSYFSSFCYEGIDDGGPWIKIELFFGRRTHNDGVNYE